MNGSRDSIILLCKWRRLRHPTFPLRKPLLHSINFQFQLLLLGSKTTDFLTFNPVHICRIRAFYKKSALVAVRETVKQLNASTMLPQIMKNKSDFGIQAHLLLAKCGYTRRYKIHCVSMTLGIWVYFLVQ